MPKDNPTAPAMGGEDPRPVCCACGFPILRDSAVAHLGRFLRHRHRSQCMEAVAQDRVKLQAQLAAAQTRAGKAEAQRDRLKLAMRRMHCNACGRPGGDGFIDNGHDEPAEPCLNCSTDEGLAPAPFAWRSMDSAPADRHIILFREADEYQGQKIPRRVTEGYWWGIEENEAMDTEIEPYWFSEDGGFTKEHPPTKWMPMPTGDEPHAALAGLPAASAEVEALRAKVAWLEREDICRCEDGELICKRCQRQTLDAARAELDEIGKAE